MYNECLSCSKLGVSCDGPNFVAMTAHEILEWCKARKHHLDLTNKEVAELAHMPKGTIDRLFAGEHDDFKYETIRPLVRALVGGKFDGNPCPEPEEDGIAEKLVKQEAEYKETINRIQKEHNEKLHKLKSEHRKETIASMKRNKIKNIIITILVVLLFISLSIIFGALIYDYMNRGVGFFWID